MKGFKSILERLRRGADATEERSPFRRHAQRERERERGRERERERARIMMKTTAAGIIVIPKATATGAKRNMTVAAKKIRKMVKAAAATATGRRATAKAAGTTGFMTAGATKGSEMIKAAFTGT